MTACPFRSCCTPQTTSVHHERLQFWGEKGNVFLFFQCAGAPAHRLLSQQGTHQDVILHHVFGVKGTNVRLSGLQLRQVALNAAVHACRLWGGGVKRNLFKKTIQKQLRDAHVAALLTLYEKTSVTVMKTASSAATEGRLSRSSRLLTE